MVNGPSQIYVERHGRLTKTRLAFEDEAHLRRIIERIVAPLGRRIDESSPMVDARLPDGSRVNAVIPPLAVHGPALTIRKFAPVPYVTEDLVRFGTLTPPMAAFLKACVAARLNILVSGGTGSGQDHHAERPVQLYSRRTSGSSPSKTPPSCSCSRNTSSRWKAARPTWRAGARSPSGTWSATPCGCGPTGS